MHLFVLERLYWRTARAGKGLEAASQAELHAQLKAAAQVPPLTPHHSPHQELLRRLYDRSG